MDLGGNGEGSSNKGVGVGWGGLRLDRQPLVRQDPSTMVDHSSNPLTFRVTKEFEAVGVKGGGWFPLTFGPHKIMKDRK